MKFITKHLSKYTTKENTLKETDGKSIFYVHWVHSVLCHIIFMFQLVLMHMWWRMMMMMMMMIQSHQSSSGLETRCPDSVVIAASNRKHRPHLLHVLHHLRHTRRSGSLPRLCYFLTLPLFMVTLCNIFLPCDFYLSFFSLPNLSGRRVDVYHSLTHGVALVQM